MPVGTTNYPGALDTPTTLIQMVNLATSTIGGTGVSDSDTTIPVVDTSRFPGSGVAWSGTEAISYTSKNATTLLGCVRGYDGTTAATHGAGVAIYGDVWVAAHHRVLADAIIAIQTMLGPNGDNVVLTSGTIPQQLEISTAADPQLELIGTGSPSNNATIKLTPNGTNGYAEVRYPSWSFGEDSPSLANGFYIYNWTNSKYIVKVNRTTSMTTLPQGLTLGHAADNTKEMTFNLANITTGTKRTMTMPDFDLTPAAQPLESILTSSFTGGNVTTAQPIFSAAQDTITLDGSKTYEFEAVIKIGRASGNTPHTTSFLFGGTATFTRVSYMAITNVTAGGASSIFWGVAATATPVTGTVSAAEDNVFYIRGQVAINAGGTIIPQIQFSQTPGLAPTFAIGTFIRFWPIGTNTVNNIGGWS